MLKYSPFPFFVISILVLVIPQSLDAGNLRGVVSSAQTGKPIGAVRVEVAGQSFTAVSDSVGRYAIDSIVPGAYSVVFTHDKFEPATENDVYVSGDAEKRLDVELTPAVASLENMVVRSASFRKAADMSSSAKTISADELLRQPGALADVQRAVQELPSVSSGGDQTNEIIVRGGMPGENLFLLDNIEIPNPNHFAQEGSGGGVISLVNPLLVKGLTFCAGAPPAQYGDKAGSVLDVKLRDGNSEMVVGGVDMGFAGAGCHVEGPLPGNCNFMASGTRSFLDFVANSKFNESATAVPWYWGTQARVARKGLRHSLYANGIYGNNGINIGNARRELGTRGNTITSGGAVYAAGVTSENILSDRLSLTLTLSAVGNDFDRLEYSDSLAPGIARRDSFYFNASREREQALKAQAAYDFGAADRLIFGGYGRRCDFHINIGASPDTLKDYSSDPSGSAVIDPATGTPVEVGQNVSLRGLGYKYGGFASGIIRRIDRVKIVPGLRFDGFTVNKSLTVSPRLSGVYSLTPNLDLTAACGVQYQQPDYTILADNPACPPKRAITGIAGVEYFIGGLGVQCICEAYYKRYDGLPVDSTLLYGTRPVEERFKPSHGFAAVGRGRSEGVEFFAQKKLTDAVSWTLSYSFSDSKNRDPRPGHPGKWYPGDFDFGQNLTVSGGWKKELLKIPWYVSLRQHLWFKLLSPIIPIADRMEFSGRWRYLGGRPSLSQTYDTTYRRWYIDENAPLNSARYQDYHALNFRFERRFGFGFLQMMYYIDFQNIYNRKNVWQYLFVEGRAERSTVYQLPFFPAGGMIIGF
jgi:hypothetical protein